MWYYLIYGLIVRCDFEFKAAYSIPDAINPDVYIEYSKKLNSEVTVQEQKLLAKYARFRHFEENYAIIRQPGQAVMEIQNGKVIKYYLYENFDSDYIEQTFLCYCMPILLLQRGMTLIHGSCLEYGDKALLISGASGSGKSSLADEILLRGHHLLSDDIIAIEKNQNNEFRIFPSFPLRKLCADIVEEKQLDKRQLISILDENREKYGLLLKEEYCTRQCIPQNMVIITPADCENPVLKEISGAEKLKYLMENFFRLDVIEQTGINPKNMQTVVQLAGQMSMYKLIRPVNRMSVKEQADLIDKIF